MYFVSVLHVGISHWCCQFKKVHVLKRACLCLPNNAKSILCCSALLLRPKVHMHHNNTTNKLYYCDTIYNLVLTIYWLNVQCTVSVYRLSAKCHISAALRWTQKIGTYCTCNTVHTTLHLLAQVDLCSINIIHIKGQCAALHLWVFILWEMEWIL